MRLRRRGIKPKKRPRYYLNVNKLTSWRKRERIYQYMIADLIGANRNTMSSWLYRNDKAGAPYGVSELYRKRLVELTGIPHDELFIQSNGN